VLTRYLGHDRVHSGAAREDAASDYRDAANGREAIRTLDRAWSDLVRDADDFLVELVGEKTEALCGFRPPTDQVTKFLRSLRPPESESRRPESRWRGTPTVPEPSAVPAQPGFHESTAPKARGVSFSVFGQSRNAPSAKEAFVEVLAELARRSPEQVESLAQAVKKRSRNHIARTVAEIYPSRPDLANAVEFSPGWLVGLNIANREKTSIIKAACDVFNLTYGKDVELDLPNT
jgi:hypothetical protein